MPKKRQNATKLSRGLFKDKPKIEPLSTLQAPDYMLGEVKELQPLRSDIGSIKVREGEEFMTYELWKTRVGRGKNDSETDYKWWRERKGLPANITARRKLKGKTPVEKRTFFEEQRREVPTTAAYSMTDADEQKERVSKLHAQRDNMTRAQQRKLGRVIRQGKTNPIKASRLDPDDYYEDRNTYTKEYYKEELLGKPLTRGHLEYEYGFNKPNTAIEKMEANRQLIEKSEARLKPYQDKLRGWSDELIGIMEEADLPEQTKDLGRGWVMDEEKIAADKAKRAGKKPRKNAKPPPTYKGREWMKSNPDRDFNSEHFVKEWMSTKGEIPTPYNYGAPQSSARQKDAGKIPDGLRVFMTPQQYKRANRLTKDMYNVHLDEEWKSAKNLRYSAKEKDDFWMNTDARTPTGQEITSKKVEFSNSGDMMNALREMKKNSEGQGLAMPIDRKSEGGGSYYIRKDTGGTSVSNNPEGLKMVEGRGERNTPLWVPDASRGLDGVWSNNPEHHGKGSIQNISSQSSWGRGNVMSKRHEKVRGDAYRKRRKFYGLDSEGVEMLTDRYGQEDEKRWADEKYHKRNQGENPITAMSDKDLLKWAKSKGHLKFDEGYAGSGELAEDTKVLGKPYKFYGGWTKLSDEKSDDKTLVRDDEELVVMDKGMRLKPDKEEWRKDSKGIYKITKKNARKKIKVKRMKKTIVPVMNNPNFQLRVARGKGRRVFHMEEGETKGWKQVKQNQYTKQVEAWKDLEDRVPKTELQLRGIRDNRTRGGRLIGQGRRGMRESSKGSYKSARDEALIQMRINESVGVRDLKTKQSKEIKDIRISEAQKALNLKLSKETAEATTKALKAKNAGLTHSYNVNVRNQAAATLLGSDPEELNKLLRKGGGIALVKTMIRKGEIVDASTIGQLNLSGKQKDNLLRLLNEGGEFVEGQEYFFRHIVDGQTRVQRGYLNKGGERKDNLELMYLQTMPDGTTETEKFLVPKVNILKADDYTSTTASGKKQREEEPRKLSEFELDLFEEEVPKPKEYVLSKEKGRGIKSPSVTPRPASEGILGTLRKAAPSHFESMGGDVNMDEELAAQLRSEEPRERSSSEEEFEFSIGSPTPEPEPSLAEEEEEFMEGMTEEEKEQIKVARTPKEHQKVHKEIEEELDLAGGGIEQEGMATQIADELGAGLPTNLAEHIRRASTTTRGTPKKSAGTPKKASELAKEEMERTMKVMSPKKPKVAFEEKEEEVEEEKPKTIADEVGELTKKEPVDVPLSGYDGFDGSSDDFPEELIEEDWDMRGRGLQSRLKEGGTQEVPEGSIAIWSTKYGDRENMNVLVINANDAYHILRGLRGVNTKDDKGKLKGVSDAKLKTMYRKILEGTRQGKKETAINDKIFLR